LARLRNVTLLAITDHDTIAANDEAISAGRDEGVRVIPGIEVSSLSKQGEVHVLGYGIRPSDEKTLDTLASLRGVREARARGILAMLETLGVHLPFERVQAFAGDGMIGRPHVARALVEAGIVASEQEAFDRYIAEGKPAFVPHSSLTPPQAVELIHAAHGVAVLAHPGLYRGDMDTLLASLLAVGLDGIEAFYPMHTSDQMARYIEIARRHDLLLTGGSDFHGARGDIELSLGSVHVPDEAIAALEARIQV
jgi:predicted metal-dependent phosphoesterase TrpH